MTILKQIENKVQVSSLHANLYDFVSRVIHSRICVVSRNITFVIGHFGIGSIPKSLLEGEMATKAIVVVESDQFVKSICTVQDFLESAYSLITVLEENDKGTSEYLNRRVF